MAAAAPRTTYALVLRSLVPPAVAKRRSSHVSIEPSLRPHKATDKEGPGVADEAGGGQALDFSGSYALDLKASSDPTKMLTALGVPWMFRKAISKASRTVHIEHDHDAWTETAVTPVLTKTTHQDLTGTPVVQISPVDKTAVTSVSSVQGDAVVTKNTYPEGSSKSQFISRTLEDGGEHYVVENTLTVGDEVIKTRSVYNRVH